MEINDVLTIVSGQTRDIRLTLEQMRARFGNEGLLVEAAALDSVNDELLEVETMAQKLNDFLSSAKDTGTG